MNNTILVVDDEEAIRNLLERAFTKAGYTVHSAESGEEALEILKQENIQVMFLDLKLPGMSGVELCTKIRKDKPIALIAGFDDYFTKPFELKVLFKAAEDAFEKIERWKKR